MKLNSVLTLIIIVQSVVTFAQPETEIFLFKLEKTNTSFSITEPWNVTYENPGYDNQPHFLPTGQSMYYVSTKNGQTDVAEVEFGESTWTWLSSSEGGEYSPTPLPDGSGFSAIRLDKDGTQLLYKYPNDFTAPTVLVPDLKIGYHCWFNENVIVAFVLGDPSTLQVCELSSGQNRIVASNIGRSLHKIPNSSSISFISKESTPWQIKELDPVSGKTKKIIETLDGSEDLAWTPDGSIIMGQGDLLYKFKPGTDSSWVKIADLADYELTGVTRIAVSPTGDRLALVVNQ